MPFGLMNAPATFQRVTDGLLQRVPYFIVYIDDVIFHSDKFQSSISHVKIVLIILKNRGLNLNLSKIYLAESKVKLLGYYIDE